ncbi:MAG: hypothetical protein B7Z81_05640 [Acidocella sp. 20-61-6]|nr:MAG: hypothetical protein B7Z81_05640 [Acidocella sp. 20-61-6]
MAFGNITVKACPASLGTAFCAVRRWLLVPLWWLSAKPRMVMLFLLCAGPVGVSMVFLTPPGQVPDEPAHMARAAALIHGAILPIRKLSVDAATGQQTLLSGVQVDTGLFSESFGRMGDKNNPHSVTLGDYWASRNVPSNHKLEFANIPNTGTYFPATYLPAAIGMAVGIAFNVDPYTCMALGRFSMLVAFLALGAACLAITAYGEALLMAVLILPMTLNLAGSLNQDGLLISMSALCAAIFTKDPSRHPRLRWLGLLLLALILGSKPPYMALLGLALLPLRAPGLWRRALAMLITALPVLFWIGLILAFAVIPLGSAAYQPGPLYQGDPHTVFHQFSPSDNLNILLNQPFRLVSMPWQLFVQSGVLIGKEMIGILGWLQLIFPDKFYSAWSIALSIALLGLVFTKRTPEGGVSAPIITGTYVLTLIISSLWAVIIVCYIDFTFVGQADIGGLQGRYLLVLMPFVTLAIPVWRSRCAVPAIVPALPAIALGFYDIGYLPLKTVAFFYMH